MDALKERVAALNSLALLPAEPDRFEQVRAALEDKFEGVQATALKVLGSWGDKASCKEIRAFLVGAFDRPYGWGVRSVAINALIPHVNEADADWILDLYFGLPDILAKHELLKLVLSLPPEAARDRLVRALRDGTPANRQAAIKAIGNMAYHDWRELITPLRYDTDDFVRDSAIALTDRV